MWALLPHIYISSLGFLSVSFPLPTLSRRRPPLSPACSTRHGPSDLTSVRRLGHSGLAPRRTLLLGLLAAAPFLFLGARTEARRGDAPRRPGVHRPAGGQPPDPRRPPSAGPEATRAGGHSTRPPGTQALDFLHRRRAQAAGDHAPDSSVFLRPQSLLP